MTQPPLIDKSWVGIECLIENSRARSLVNGANRFAVTLSFASSEQVRELIAELAINNHGKCFVGFGFLQVQAELPFDAAAMGDAPQGAVVLQASNGDVIAQHAFRASEEDPAKCTFCEAGASSEIHEEQPARDVVQHAFRPSPADMRDPDLCFWCRRPSGDEEAHFPAAVVTEIVNDGAEADVSRIGPGDADEAAEQAVAEAALASRSKGR